MSPLKLRLCLHYATAASDDPWVNSGAPIVAETMRELVAAGLLIEFGKPANRFGPTDKLFAFAKMLQATPLPELAYIDPRFSRQEPNQ